VTILLWFWATVTILLLTTGFGSTKRLTLPLIHEVIASPQPANANKSSATKQLIPAVKGPSAHIDPKTVAQAPNPKHDVTWETVTILLWFWATVTILLLTTGFGSFKRLVLLTQSLIAPPQPITDRTPPAATQPASAVKVPATTQEDAKAALQAPNPKHPSIWSTEGAAIILLLSTGFLSFKHFLFCVGPQWHCSLLSHVLAVKSWPSHSNSLVSESVVKQWHSCCFSWKLLRSAMHLLFCSGPQWHWGLLSHCSTLLPSPSHSFSSVARPFVKHWQPLSFILLLFIILLSLPANTLLMTIANVSKSSLFIFVYCCCFS